MANKAALRVSLCLPTNVSNILSVSRLSSAAGCFTGFVITWQPLHWDGSRLNWQKMREADGGGQQTIFFFPLLLLLLFLHGEICHVRGTGEMWDSVLTGQLNHVCTNRILSCLSFYYFFPLFVPVRVIPLLYHGVVSMTCWGCISGVCLKDKPRVYQPI